jgi:hypothetical protein
MSMETKQDDGGPAFPVADVAMAEPQTIDEGRAMARGGLTVHDYFAAKALQGLIAGSMADGSHLDPSGDPDRFAEMARLIADAMLRARALGK